ncbi:cytosine deaminase [Chelatococcus daeguensis]|uniref:Cytosine deaminase n=1 Tax=Chelatococcus daeguensis TaxID=444444 RepID=A0AAC9JSF4_9HYPH|nr:cytosine deaminase [Chelatococcus daeguensis]APF38401.1 cytosine deaminase [Chelatococcus daeguensis]
MSRGFLSLPDTSAFVLADATVPAAVLPAAALRGAVEGLVRCDIHVADGRIARIAPVGGGEETASAPTRVGLDGGIVLPRLVDVHTHLDKGHIWPRTPNPDGSFMGALDSAGRDRIAFWSAEDVAARMDFALRCALAHGTGAVRTHLDSLGPQTAISWPVFAEMREAWKGRIALQATALFTCDIVTGDEPQFRDIVATVARHGGVLGGVTFLGAAPDAALDLALDRIFMAAAANGLDLDFHVDESDAPEARSLERIADAAMRHRFKGRILAGHCCSLALQNETDAARVIDKLGEAGIAVVSLPMCNMYLQDRRPGRTPRWRGVAPLHELKAAGVPVMVASDNTRDPFYAYGDLDMVEVFREATRVAHLDHNGDDWIATVTTTPGDVMRLADAGRLAEGGPADLVLTRARSWTELLARPQADRVVVVAGRALDEALPDYHELDRLVAAQREGQDR